MHQPLLAKLRTDMVRAVQDFQQHKTSMLLLTAEHARGLDLPAVSHVYNYGIPASTTEYVHRAGRAGRLGHDTQGVVTTITTAEELPRLKEMAAEIGIDLELIEVGVADRGAGDAELLRGEEQLDTAKKFLEDLYNLY
jgi:superfamily II DNA/RNA helicase